VGTAVGTRCVRSHGASSAWPDRGDPRATERRRDPRHHVRRRRGAARSRARGTDAPAPARLGADREPARGTRHPSSHAGPAPRCWSMGDYDDGREAWLSL